MMGKRFYLKLMVILVILVVVTGCTADSQVRKTPVAGWCDDSAGMIIPEDVRCYFENAEPPSMERVEPSEQNSDNSEQPSGILKEVVSFTAFIR